MNSFVDLERTHPANGLSDRVARGFTKLLRFFADKFFAKRYGHRAIVLETVAAVPGMVGSMLQHLKSLRHMADDHGWIRVLMDEAENERMHLLTFIEIARSSGSIWPPSGDSNWSGCCSADRTNIAISSRTR